MSHRPSPGARVVRRALVPAALFGLVAAVGSTAGAQEQQVTKDSAAAQPAAEPKTNVVANLQPRAGGRARATLTLSPGRRPNEVRARISVVEAAPNGQLGWLIRQGQCGEMGPEYGPIAAYRPIMVRSDGTAELSVNLPIAMPRRDAYQALLLSEPRDGSVLACGGLAEEVK